MDTKILTDRIRTIMTDPRGYLWIGTRDFGLDRLDIASGQIEHFAHASDNPNSISNDDIYALAIGQNAAPEGKVIERLDALRYADDDAVRYHQLFERLGAESTLLSVLDEQTQRRYPGLAAHAVAPTLENIKRVVRRYAAQIEADECDEAHQADEAFEARVRELNAAIRTYNNCMASADEPSDCDAERDARDAAQVARDDAHAHAKKQSEECEDAGKVLQQAVDNMEQECQ